MAILLRLKVSATSPRERVLDSIDISQQWLERIGFIGEKYELWEDSYIEDAGGRKRIESKSLREIKGLIANQDPITLSKVIVLYKGHIQLDRPLYLSSPNEKETKLNKLPATYYLFNRKLRKVVGASSLFYIFTIPDWELYMKERQFKEKIEKSIFEKIDSLIVGKNQFATHDIRERIFCYHQKRRDFIIDIFRTIKEEIEEEAAQIPDLVKPYNIDFLANVLDSFGEKLDTKLRKFFANKLSYKVGSIMLEALDEEAFERFYIDFRKNFVDNLKRFMPDSKKLRDLLYYWVREERKLEEFHH